MEPGGDRGGSRREAPVSPLIGIVGPTASGKSDLAQALAGRLPVEILVADSRQVYRGMDVGTAKPGAAARSAVRHHLIDLVDPDQPFTVADWVAQARSLLPAIHGRGHLPMLVGGTGLYVAALVDGHDYAAQPSSTTIRRRLSDELEGVRLEVLAGRLIRLAPDVAAATDLRNSRRVVRALERVEAGGGGATLRANPHAGRVVLIAIDRPRAVLYRRIDERARALFTTGGLLDEVRALRTAGFGPELRPMTGHGYGEAMRLLAGECGLEAAIDDTARRTRQYAKRQLTWFRRDARTRWLPTGDLEADDPQIVDEAERLVHDALT